MNDTGTLQEHYLESILQVEAMIREAKERQKSSVTLAWVYAELKTMINEEMKRRGYHVYPCPHKRGTIVSWEKV